MIEFSLSLSEAFRNRNILVVYKFGVFFVNGKVIDEQTKIVSICTEYKNLVQKAANLYKEFFEQDAVAISTLPALEMV